MAESALAPASSTARAISVISVTFGDSFTNSGRWVFARTSLTSWCANVASTPKLIPPQSKFGQEILSSIPATPSALFSFSVTIRYSSTVLPQTLTITGTSKSRR